MATAAKIGVSISDLHLPGREAIHTAAQLGYRSIVIDTVGTEFEPRRFGQTARRDLRHIVNHENMEIAALAVDIGGTRFGDARRLDEGGDRTSQALQMAREIHVPIVVLNVGAIVPDNGQLLDAMRLTARVADGTGTFVALLTGDTEPTKLAELMGAVGASSIKACYDPAGLMLAGFEALSGIAPLADQIILAYARDAIPGSGSASGRETALGEGHLDLAEYIGALHEAGYFGRLIVRRMHAVDPVAEMGHAREIVEAVG